MNELLEPFTRMLETVVTPAAVRAVEDGGSIEAMWDEFASSGFLDALVADEAGGAGLSLAQVGPLWQALGQFAVPVPVGETMIARHLLAGSGVAAPEGPIVLASGAPGTETIVPFARIATHALIDLGDRLVMTEVVPHSTGAHADLSAVLRCDADAVGSVLPRPAGGLRVIAALLRAALIAGGAARLLDMTIAYANERVQFGKPIGRQQAIQQNLAVVAEQVVSSRMAVELACAGGLPVAINRAAVAKSLTSGYAAHIANTTHAIHGAIGMSEEYDLQLFTRRLHQNRMADGSESYWNRLLGKSCLVSDTTTIDWVRTELFDI